MDDPALPAVGTGAAISLRSSPPRLRLHELDGLRAVAVLLVVFTHSFAGPTSDLLVRLGLPRLGQAVPYVSTSGVDLFFVLSGVVLLRPYLRRQRPFVIRTYLWRRVQRLWPPYAAALLFAGVVILATHLHPTWYSRSVLPKISVLGWVRQVGIVNLGWTTYNGAWWSLSLEVIFYLLAPLAVVGLLLFGRRRYLSFAAVPAAVVLSLIDVNLNWHSVGDVPYLFGTYLPCFALGCLLARVDLNRRAGMALVAFGCLYSILGFEFPSLNGHIGLAALYGGLITLALSRRRLSDLLARPRCVWLGERSYSLFLVHFSVFYLTDYLASLVLQHRSNIYVVVSRGLGLPLALLGAMVLFSMVERRFARGLVTANSFWPWQPWMPVTTGAPAPAAGTAHAGR